MQIAAGTKAKLEDAMSTLDILKIIYMLINDLNQTIIKPDNRAFLNCLLGDFKLALVKNKLNEAAEMLLKVNQTADSLLTMTKNKETDHQQIQASLNKAKSLNEKIKVLALQSGNLITTVCKKPEGAFNTALKLIIENTPGAEKPENINDLNTVTAMQLQKLKPLSDQIQTLYDETSTTHNSVKEVYLTILDYQQTYEKPIERAARREGGILPTPGSSI